MGPETPASSANGSDAEDNCPAIEHPGHEDEDDDGVGDACQAGGNPNDLDDDGSDDVRDNCLGLSNADQADRDEDGIGDACNACPDELNDDATPCMIAEDE